MCQNIRFLSKKYILCYKTTILRCNLKVEDTCSVTKIITALIHGNPEVEDARGELLVVFSAPNSDPTWIFFPLNHLEVVKSPNRVFAHVLPPILLKSHNIFLLLKFHNSVLHPIIMFSKSHNRVFLNPIIMFPNPMIVFCWWPLKSHNHVLLAARIDLNKWNTNLRRLLRFYININELFITTTRNVLGIFEFPV